LQPFAKQSHGFHQNAQKNHCPPVNAKFISVKYSLIIGNWIHVMSDVNMTPLTVEDRLLIKTLQTEKGWIVWKK